MEESPWSNIYVIMTKDLFYDKSITLSEKVFLAYVRGFELNGKRCFASSEHVAELFAMEPGFVRKIRNSLVKKGKLVKRDEDGLAYYETIYEACLKDTEVYQNDTEAVSKRHGGRVKKTQGVCLKDTEGVSKRHAYNKDIDLVDNKVDKKVYKHPTPTHPDPDINKHLKNAFMEPTGNLEWERSNAYLIAGRRPLQKYPLIMLSNQELISMLEELKKYGLSPKDVLVPLQQRIEQKAVEGKNFLLISGYQYFGYVLNEVLETEIKTERLKKVTQHEI
jgi:hypothetical protein